VYCVFCVAFGRLSIASLSDFTMRRGTLEQPTPQLLSIFSLFFPFYTQPKKFSNKTKCIEFLDFSFKFSLLLLLLLLL
jgi:hypothetical protein